MKKVQFVGLDVHADTIAVAVAEPDGTVRSVGVIPNRPESIRKLVKRLGSPEQLRACYEAGPTGYVLYWQLTALGVRCEVVAPTLVPVKAGDRVKTDRRDALKLARSYRAGDLTPVWVPDAAHEALRDVVRAREAAKKAARAPSAGEVSAATRPAPSHWHQPLDPAVSPVGEGRPVCRSGARGDALGLSPRGRTYGRSPHAARGRPGRGGAGDPRPDASRDRRAAGAARGRAGVGGHNRGRTGPGLALWPPLATDEL